jgi:hypothetical protein
LVRVEAKTSATPGAPSDPFSGRRQSVDYVEKAQQRINELKGAPSPWHSASTQHGGGVITANAVDTGAHEITVNLEGRPTVAVSPDAEAAALAIFGFFRVQPPPSAVAIFPREDGGLRLQTVGDERAVIVDISGAGTEFVGEYAGDDVYHTETMRSFEYAARFIVNATR